MSGLLDSKGLGMGLAIGVQLRILECWEVFAKGDKFAWKSQKNILTQYLDEEIFWKESLH